MSAIKAFLTHPTVKNIARWIFAVSYTGAGFMHFIQPEFYLRIMPPYFPEPLLLIYLTGVLEILAGVGILVPQTRKIASWGTIFMLIAFLPVHVYMLQNAELFADLGPKIGLWLRFPIQAGLILWAWWAGRK